MSEKQINIKKRAKWIGWAGAILVHLLLIIGLLLAGFSIPEPPEEGGMPVMLGNVPDAGGSGELVPVEAMPAESSDLPKAIDTPPVDTAPAPEPPAAKDSPLITQEEESAPIKAKPKKVEKPKPTAAQLEAEAKRKAAEEAARKRAAEEAEQKRLAEEKARKEREAAEATRKRVAGAFGKGAQMGGQGNATGQGNTSGQGQQGSPTGNSLNGATQGVGGYGSFSLSGRSLGPGGLPKPAYNVADEGKVVVSIVVNPAGQVISTSIHKETNTVNVSLRRAAEEAARKAHFNSVEGANNQTGTITYYFNLK